MKIITGKKEFFPGVGKINYEGAQSDNPLAYRWYDENKMVAGKSMKDHLRFACAYWHSFCGSGADPFGEPTHLFHGMKKQMRLKEQKIKLMPLLNSLQNWACLIIVFMMWMWLIIPMM